MQGEISVADFFARSCVTRTSPRTISRLEGGSATAGAEVSKLSTESSGGARSRTADLGIMSGIRGEEDKGE
jgi:hypothetical protein